MSSTQSGIFFFSSLRLDFGHFQFPFPPPSNLTKTHFGRGDHSLCSDMGNEGGKTAVDAGDPSDTTSSVSSGDIQQESREAEGAAAASHKLCLQIQIMCHKQE